jgi:hypothetical protein
MEANKRENSIVLLSCLYDDWASAAELFKNIGHEFHQREWSFQLVIINDGSQEPQPPAFLKNVVGFHSIEIVRLRRNVGHQRAIAIGLSHIFEKKNVDAVAILDSDGEDRPEDLIRLIEAHASLEEPIIIFAERTRRSETFLFQFFYQIYRILHLLLTGYRIRFGNFSIVPHQSLGCLVVDPNLWLHFAASVVASRSRYTTIPTTRGVRIHGQSKLNFTSLVIHGLAALACYNEIVGVRLLFCAVSFSFVLFLMILAVFVERVATSWAIPGWATYTTGILFIILTEFFLIVMAFVAIAVSSRKSHFFLPLQQYRFLIDEISII